uniref:Uncharacterized protein n=1 Tax=Candidatus Methanophagaceae archaeon ANME-1 ERB6 TaxID=2759912 RepID=A0A7G9YSZ6_9EURY|nr:hypothetical protein OLNPMGDC_00021 [Methanosarcinales archaeon ANME-1 ERB6]
MYNRPFDDQSQKRIFLETIAFITLLELVENLGISGATEFIIQYEKGDGDYTEMRKEIFDKKGLDEILEEMKSVGGDKEK